MSNYEALNSTVDAANESEALISADFNNRRASKNCALRSCPTCRGSGKVAMDEKNELIALIPVSDKRLRPRRIWLWILLTVLVCMLVAGTLLYLLAPRENNVSNDITELQPVNLTRLVNSNNETIGLIILFKDSFLIQNNNYFSINLNGVQFEINRNSHSITPNIKYNQNMVIHARQRELVDILVEYVIYSEDDPYADFCLNGLIKNLFSLVKTTFTVSTIWSANLQTHISVMQYIGCYLDTNSTLYTKVIY